MSIPITIPKADAEIIDFIASGATPKQIISFQASKEVNERVANLIEREKTTGLSKEEKSELDNFLQLEHLMRLIKARASQYINRQKKTADILAEIASLPLEGEQDKFSGRDHNKILYSGQNRQ